jgi:hypothetical protein
MADAAPVVVFTNIFTLDGEDPSGNQYLNMFAIWYQFLRRFGGLRLTQEDFGTGAGAGASIHARFSAPRRPHTVDEIHVAIDSTSLAFLQQTTRGTGLLDGIHFHTYTPPRTLKQGMLHRYEMACHFQWVWPGRSFLYLDVDTVVCRPLRTLFNSPEALNRLWYTTEERIQHLNGDILSPNYLAGRLVLNPPEYGMLFDQAGITSGIFGWNHVESHFGNVFCQIASRAKEDTVNEYYTIDQPYFNEAVVSKMLRGINEVFHLNSDHIGINEPLSPTSPYIIVNYSGEPGNGVEHILKMEQAFHTVFGSA